MVHLVMLVHSVISAGTFLVAKRALGELSALELGLVRFTLAASVYGALLWRLRVRVARRDVARLAALGLMAIPLNQGLFLVGLARTTSGHGALLYALTPIFVFLIARARLGERATPLKLAGIGVAFAGVLVVLLPRGAVARPIGDAAVGGDLLILAAVAAYAVFATGGKPFAERYGSVASTGLITISGALLFLPLGLARSDPRHLAQLSATGWLAIAYLVLVASVGSYVLYYWVLARAEASRVAIWSNLQPVLTAAMAWAIYGEQLTASFIAGGAMVVAGVVVTERA
jgi:drug/metabolite transporter (DMT)-like permease